MVASEKIKVVIAEDDTPTRVYLEKLLKEMDNIEVLASVPDGQAAYKAVLANDPDLLVLDIEMPGLNAFELLARLDSPPPVVFVTAYDEYAVRAFEVNAIDYVLKPIKPERLREAINRAFERLKHIEKWRTDFKEFLEKFNSERLLKLPVVTPSSLKLVPLDEIVWIEASGDSSVVHMRNGDAGRVPKRIGELERMLPQSRFMRVHRSLLVNLAHIEEIVPWFNGEYMLKMCDGSEVIVARRRVKALKARFGLA